MIKINFNNIANYLIILLPAFLITGPFLSDLSVVIIDIIFIYYLIKEKNFKFLNNFLFKILIIFNIYITIRSLFADDMLYSLKSSFTYMRFIFFIFAVNFFLNKNEKLIIYFSKIFFLTILILFSDSIFQYFFGYNFLGYANNNPDKLNGLFGDEGVLGSYLIRLLPLLMCCYLYLYENKNQFYFIFILTAIGSLIFLSGSRTSVALLILFISILFIIVKDYRKYFLLLIVMASLFLSIIISYENMNSKIKQEAIGIKDFNSKIGYRVYYNIYDPFLRIFSYKHNTTKNDYNSKNFRIFSEVYESHYKTAYKMFINNKIFGVGNKMYRKLCDNEKYYVNNFSCTTHPHNFYMQILAENGIVGLIFILFFFSYIVKNLFNEFISRNFKNKMILNNKALLILIGFFINLWPIIPSGSFYNNWLSILIYLPVGFYLFFKKKTHE